MWSDVLTKPLQGMLFKRMRAELMNVEVNYDDKIECKNTHPKLLPQAVKDLSSETVELLAKSGVLEPPQNVRKGNPMVVLASKQVTFQAPLPCRRSVLSNDKIANLRKRIDKSRIAHSVKLNGGITERLRSNGRLGDSLLRQ